MSRGHPYTQALAALAAATAATGVAAVLDGHMSVAGLAMVYLVAVVASAMALGRAASTAASLLCVSALNFFFVPPRFTFAVEGAEYWWTLAVLLALALALNTLIAHLREQRRLAETAANRAGQLHALSETLAACRGAAEAAGHAAAWLQERLGRPCAVFLREPGTDGLQCLAAPQADAARFHPRSAQWAADHGLPLGRGCHDWPDLRLWCAPLSRHGGSGAVQVLLPDGEVPEADELVHWQALAGQAGLAVERERADAAAREAIESARAEAARNTLLASLSHDLRTPLAAIVGSASALRAQDSALPAAQRDRLLATLEDEARDLALMAENVLQMARLSQPHVQLKMQWESVEDILGAAAARARRRFGTARVRIKVAPGLPPLQAEAGLLAQALTNLVDNAVRHGGADAQVTIRAGHSRDGVFIAVRDQGPGVPEATLATLFERYRRGDGQRAGAGIGLAICRLAVQAHGGRIEARRCEPGLEFRIDLPVPAAQAASSTT